VALPPNPVRVSESYRTDEWIHQARSTPAKSFAQVNLSGPSPFDRCRFDQKKCEAGIEALGFYHEKKDEQRSVGLGPSHDWSSHAADAFGLMAVDRGRHAGSNGTMRKRDAFWSHDNQHGIRSQ
jgi:hypothetical protein